MCGYWAESIWRPLQYSVRPRAERLEVGRKKQVIHKPLKGINKPDHGIRRRAVGLSLRFFNARLPPLDSVSHYSEVLLSQVRRSMHTSQDHSATTSMKASGTSKFLSWLLGSSVLSSSVDMHNIPQYTIMY